MSRLKINGKSKSKLAQPFNEDNALTQILNPVIKLWRMFNCIPPDNNSMIKELIEPLSQLPFFQKSTPEETYAFITNSVQYFQYRQISKGQAVYHYGDKSDRVYLILRGSVVSYVPRHEEDIKRDIVTIVQNKQDGLQGLDLQYLLGIQQFDPNQAQQELIRYWKNLGAQHTQWDQLLLNKNAKNYFHQEYPVSKFMSVSKQVDGMSVGESALSSEQVRQESIIVESDQLQTIFLMKSDYKRVIDFMDEAMNDRIIYFMKHFDRVSKQSVAKFITNYQNISFNPSTVIWREGETPEYYFIIKTGLCELSKMVEGKSISLCKLSNDSFLGHDDIIENRSMRSTMCKAIEITEAYYMKADELNNIRKNYPEIIKCLREQNNQIGKYMKHREATVISKQKEILESISMKPPESPSERRCTIDLAEGKHIDDSILRSFQSHQLTKQNIVDQNIRLHNILYKRSIDQFGDVMTEEFNLVSKDQLVNLKERIIRQFSDMRGFKRKQQFKISSTASSEVLSFQLLKKMKNREEQRLKQSFSVSHLVKGLTNKSQNSKVLTNNSIQINSLANILVNKSNPKLNRDLKLLSSHNLSETIKWEQQWDGIEFKRLHSAVRPFSRPSKISRFSSVPQVSNAYFAQSEVAIKQPILVVTPKQQIYCNIKLQVQENQFHLGQQQQQQSMLLLDIYMIFYYFFNNYYILMLKKLQEYHSKVEQEEEQLNVKTSTKDEFKKLILQRNRERQVQLPKFSQIVDGNIICTICSTAYTDTIKFKIHITQQYHLEAIQTLKQSIDSQKRKAQVQVDDLIREADQHNIVKVQSKKKLTREQIERISREVDAEFQEEVQQPSRSALPADFFEQIENEVKMEDELQGQMITPPPKKIDNFEDDLKIIEDIKTKLKNSLQKKPKKISKYDYFDSPIEEDQQDLPEFEWKKKEFY